MPPDAENTRIGFIDRARLLAMALVFYGHFIERVMYLKNPTAAAQYKFIYSFHMVLFVVIAGYVARESVPSLRLGTFLKQHSLSRLLPFGFFTLLFMGAAAVFPGDFFHLELPSLQGYIDGLLNTVFGIPMFCVPSWFLLLIFSVGLLHYTFSRFLNTDAKIGIGMVVFYGIGCWINGRFDLFNPVKGRVIGWNYLFIHEAVLLYAFFLLGVLMRRGGFLRQRPPLKVLVPAVVVMFGVVLFTYDLNSGHFSFAPLDAVVIMLSSHGHPFWFPITALAGSLMILLLARALPARKTVDWMGQNTLMLMCLNGIFYHYVNPPVAEWFVGRMPGTPLVTLLAGCAVTAVSLIACIPLMVFFNAWVPQLVGKPKVKGPLMRNLV